MAKTPTAAGCSQAGSGIAQSVLLSINGGPPILLEFREGQTLRVGRAPSCDIVLESAKVSGHHLELSPEPDGASKCRLRLSARDNSTNSTGMRLGAQAEWEELNRGEPRVLLHGAELLVPFRTAPPGKSKSKSSKPSSSKAERTRITVQYPDEPPVHHLDTSALDLPDAFDPETGVGRWLYCDQLGEGGLGVVYRAFDMVGDLGNVAVKVAKWASKDSSRAAHEAWQVYIMHREAQWSQQCLHCPADPRYKADLAPLFVRYLEDHTGFPSYHAAEEFEAARVLYEKPDLKWGSLTFSPPLPASPYVVMELAFGRALSNAKPEETLSMPERSLIIQQAAQALDYLCTFGLIHRDYRTSNMHVAGRGNFCRLKVLDLGLVIATEATHVMNPNMAVKACWHRKQRQYDWVPPEVKTRPFPNYALPGHSFDVFSLAVLVLRLFGGKQWAREMLQIGPGATRWRADLLKRGLAPELLQQMLGVPKQRPPPRRLVRKAAELLGGAAEADAAPDPCAATLRPPDPRTARSRSRRRRPEPAAAEGRRPAAGTAPAAAAASAAAAAAAR